MVQRELTQLAVLPTLLARFHKSRKLNLKEYIRLLRRMSAAAVQYGQNQNSEMSLKRRILAVMLFSVDVGPFICRAFAPDLEVDHINLKLSTCRQ